MKRMLIAAIFFISAGLYAEDLSDSEIRQLLIQQSISSYSGSCPCPYNVMRNGRRCGETVHTVSQVEQSHCAMTAMFQMRWSRDIVLADSSQRASRA